MNFMQLLRVMILETELLLGFCGFVVNVRDNLPIFVFNVNIYEW